MVADNGVVISFVVPAHNEERLLGRTLTAIHEAARTLPHSCEIIVVNDASTDGTAAIARAHGTRVIEVDVRQIAKVRNAGAREAQGDILIFVDADTVVSNAVVRASLNALRCGAVGGGATIEFDGAVPWWSSVLLHVVRGTMRAARLIPGCYVFCSRTAFEAAGGFDEGLYAAEEISFSRALGRKGTVVTLRETVITSGRKMRTHSAWDLVRLTAAAARRGTGVVRSREQLSLWYGERRNEQG